MSVGCSPMIWETWVQSQVASYQRLYKWYVIPPCLTLSNIRYVSRVKWSNPGKGVAPSLTPRCSSYWKGSLLDVLDYSCRLTIFVQIAYIILWYNTLCRRLWKFYHNINYFRTWTYCTQIKIGIIFPDVAILFSLSIFKPIFFNYQGNVWVNIDKVLC